MRAVRTSRWVIPTIVALCAVALPSRVARAQSATPSVSWSDQRSWDIAGEYVVDFRDDAESSAIASFLSRLGLKFRPTGLEAETRIEIVSVARGRIANVLAKLKADPRVEHVEPHARVRGLFVPDDPMYRQQWHLKRVGAEDAWRLSVGRGVTVAVIDTGVACETIDGFKKATDLVETRCVDGYNFVKNNQRASDDQGHGTHVAGTIAQSTDNALGAAGLAFRARLMPVKVLSADGWGTTTAVADGIRWAADHGAHVINLSLGGPRNSFILQRAVDHARSRGVVVVAAAGNSGGSVGFPGASRGVIGVSATDGNDKLAWFSSRGKGVDIAAPGVDVVQQTICDRGLNGCEVFPSYNGTSMACPHVAGAAALLVSLGVSDPAAIEHYLKTTARSLGDDPEGHRFGAGLLQAQAAAERASLVQIFTRLIALLLAAFAAFKIARKKGQPTVKASNPMLLLVALVSGVGLLFFAPWLVGRHHLWVDLLARPLCEWDLLIGASLHKFLPLANIAIPLALSAALLSVKRAAPALAGLSIGIAGYLTSVAVLGQLATPFGWLITTAWCAFNALGCVYLASLLLLERQAEAS